MKNKTTLRSHIHQLRSSHAVYGGLQLQGKLDVAVRPSQAYLVISHEAIMSQG